MYLIELVTFPSQKQASVIEGGLPPFQLLHSKLYFVHFLSFVVLDFPFLLLRKKKCIFIPNISINIEPLNKLDDF